MIELVSTGALCVKVAREDFDVWDHVLRRLPGVRLETISRAGDRADAAHMLFLTDAHSLCGHPHDD
jgi:hypothetical protein